MRNRDQWENEKEHDGHHSHCLPHVLIMRIQIYFS